jgi:pimeloyl-ACP methyl ester carboxylesterase
MNFARKMRIRLALIALPFLALFLIMHSCMTFRMSEKEIDSFFKKNNVQGSQHHYQINGRTIHYVQAGGEQSPLVLFVHGSPGSLSAFIHFLADSSLTGKALLITSDRPGFGYSNFGIAEPSIQKQAETLIPILEKHQVNRPVILVGHSLGGPVIAQMAIDHPDLVDGLILIAPSIDPELEPNETWFRAPLATPFLSWILPRSFRSSNEEIYQLKPQLVNMLPLWASIKCPVIVIQGGKDTFVPSANADFAQKMLVNAPVTLITREDMNHFVPWTNPELIQQAILKLLHDAKAEHSTGN